MQAAFKTAVFAVAFAIATMSGAQAAVLNLDGYIGGANVFSFNDFKAASSDVEGAIMAGGNVDVSHYTTNLKNKPAYGNYAMVVGGNLTYNNGGNIHNGDVYVGGTAALGINMLDKGYEVKHGATPANIDMTRMASTLTTVSSELTHLATTGTAKEKWGGVFLTGTGTTGVEVINVDASWLVNSTYFDVSNVSSSATLIVNFIGSSVGFHGGFGEFDGLNVLFNTTASNVTINNGFHASLLAPNAAINGGEGEVNGTIIVKSWDSTIQINGTNAFKAADVPGLTTAVPEADTYAMLLGGLALLGFIARRRKQAAAR